MSAACRGADGDFYIETGVLRAGRLWDAVEGVKGGVRLLVLEEAHLLSPVSDPCLEGLGLGLVWFALPLGGCHDSTGLADLMNGVPAS